jgi:hypothetical protein
MTSLSGGRSQSTRREPPTMGKQLVNVITSAVFAYRLNRLKPRASGLGV